MAKRQQPIPADKLEETVRLLGLEQQISTLVTDIQNIELNASWVATEIGKAAQMAEHNYTEEELATVMVKQEANRERLRAKADHLKGIYNKRVNS